MAHKLFEVEGGYSDGNIHYLSGAGAPSSTTFLNDAPVGSVYEDSVNFDTYKKVTDTDSASDWKILVNSSKVVREEVQANHGFVVGDWIYRDAGGLYVKGLADSIDTADVIGVVESVADLNTFTVVSSGWSDVTSTENEGSALFLSDLTAGAATAVKPSFGVQKNLGYVIDGKVFVGIDLSIEIATSEAPAVPLIVTDNITTIQTVAQLLTQEDHGALWVLQASSASGRYSSLVHANHDGFGADATMANWCESAVVEAGAEIAGLGIGMSVSGTGATQTMNLTVVATDPVDVSVRQVKL